MRMAESSAINKSLTVLGNGESPLFLLLASPSSSPRLELVFSSLLTRRLAFYSHRRRQQRSRSSTLSVRSINLSSLLFFWAELLSPLKQRLEAHSHLTRHSRRILCRTPHLQHLAWSHLPSRHAQHSELRDSNEGSREPSRRQRTK